MTRRGKTSILPSRRKASRGATLVEFAIVTPTLIICLFGMFDLSELLQNYLNLTRVAYEGARFGASVMSLEEGQFSNPTPEMAQARIRSRVETLLQAYHLTSYAPQITSSYHLEDPTKANMVEVNIEIQ